MPILLVSVFKYIAFNFDPRLSASIYLVGFHFAQQLIAMLLSPLVGYGYDQYGFADVYLVMSTGAAFVAVFANYVAPAAVFEFLLASSGAIALLVYLVIAISQLRMRKKRTEKGEKIEFKMWLFPGLTDRKSVV